MLGWRWWCGLALLALILGLFRAEKHLLSGKSDVKEDMASLLGGKFQADGEENSLEIEDIAKFAVDEYNGRQNSVENVSYVRVVSAKKQVVAGTMYHLTIEVLSEDQPKLYEAKVWAKPWEQHKTLEEFKLASHSAVTHADLGVRRDGHHSVNEGDQGLREVPCDDPVVKEAAEQALKGLQQRSNSLFPYELQDVVSALAEVTGEKTNFQLLLKVKRGTREEHVKAEVHRTADGHWNVGHAQPQ
ncbi:hypothetical protein O6H91_04G105200 [Diphasiastrum complanatum]|nr:hypothetical protein O6H91_04G103000 [Diphasiastrum complanatum]KAJ7559885.1 hypothetical protein O6H91_04G105200 [Diphasiastrum complanatum]